MAGTRQKARSAALQALYEADTASHPAQEVLERLLIEKRFSGESQEFARGLVRGVGRYQRQIDEVLQKAAPLWPLHQIAVIDRNVLRLAIYEIVFDNGEHPAPPGIVINEAVALVKQFGSEGSSRFVNGVLGTVASAPAGKAETKGT